MRQGPPEGSWSCLRLHGRLKLGDQRLGHFLVLAVELVVLQLGRLGLGDAVDQQLDIVLLGAGAIVQKLDTISESRKSRSNRLDTRGVVVRRASVNVEAVLDGHGGRVALGAGVQLVAVGVVVFRARHVVVEE